MRHDLLRTREAGFDWHVAKPFNMAALGEAITAVLGLEKESADEMPHG